MPGVEARRFDAPDETRTPDKTKIDVVRMGGTTAARFAFDPGWKWSVCIKPVVGTESCQVHHVGVVQSGRMHVTTRTAPSRIRARRYLCDRARARRVGARRRTLCWI